MAIINTSGYIEFKSKTHKNNTSKSSNRIFSLVKERKEDCGYVYIGELHLSKEHIGKRIRFKVEFMDDCEKNNNHVQKIRKELMKLSARKWYI